MPREDVLLKVGKEKNEPILKVNSMQFMEVIQPTPHWVQSLAILASSQLGIILVGQSMYQK